MRRTAFAFALAAMLAAMPADAADPKAVKAGDTLAGKVLPIDGDTLWLTDADGDRHRVRLWGIDAPEMRDWPWGPWARAALDMLVGFGGAELRCTVVDIDRYKRPVARCRRADGDELSALMVQTGLAIEHRLFSDGELHFDQTLAIVGGEGVFAAFPYGTVNALVPKPPPPPGPPLTDAERSTIREKFGRVLDGVKRGD